MPVRIRINIAAFAVILALAAASVWAVSKDAAKHNEDGVAALKSGDYYSAIDCFSRALSYESDNQVIKNNLSNAYNNYGLYQLKKGQTLNAIDNFEKSLRFNPENLYAMIDLGQAYYKSNRLDKAVYYFEEAYKRNKDIPGLSEMIDKIKRESPIESDLSKLNTAHFYIISDDKLETDNLANVRIVLEQAYSSVGSFLGYFPEEKTGVILYPEQVYAQATQGRPYWAHAVFDGKIRIPVGDRIYSRDFLRKVIYHEYAHAVVRYITKGRCPIWLNEGVASYVEGFVERRDRDFFRAYITRETFVPFSSLPADYSSIRNSREANLFYREFYLTASFIIDKYGNTVLRNLLDSFGSGYGTAQAIEANFSVGETEFGDLWKAYVMYKLGL